MRIVGGHDFYDNALAFGIDTTTVFVRHKERVISEEYCGIRIPKRHDYSFFVEFPYMFVIAGNLYPMIEIQKYSASTAVRTWDFDHYKEVCDGLSPHFKKYSDGKNARAFFARTLKDDERAWLIDQRISILHNRYRLEYDVHSGHRNVCEWLVNSSDLNQFGLQARTNAYQIFQNLSMWVGGVLPKNPNPMVEITDDKVKIAKHGMDRWSFRKHKDDNK